MLEVTPLAWAATVGAIAALLAIDLFVAGARAHVVGFREAVGWSLFYVAVALVFGVVFGMLAGWGFGAQYFAGYIVEKSLSVDNLFVFVILMTTFAVPAEHQQRLLTFGILAALVLRAIFIALGAALLSLFSFMFLLFGLLLIFTAVQLFRHRDEDPSIEDNALVVAARRILPFTDRYHGGKLIVRVDGRRVLTPLSLVLVAIGSTDVLFALDSIPAVFGVTEEAFIVFTANAFALLGLRALYLLVSGLLDRLCLPLNRAVAHPRLHRRQAHVALPPRPGRHLPRDLDRPVAGRDRCRPGGYYGGELDQGSARPHRARPPRLAAPSRDRPGRGPLGGALWGNNVRCNGGYGVEPALESRRTASDALLLRAISGTDGAASSRP